MFKSNFEQIVDVNSIGKKESPINLHELLYTRATKENMKSSINDTERVLLLLIDYQMDFMPHGSLGVPGADMDVGNICKWIYVNSEKITRIAYSIDSHMAFQIFHPAWWIKEDGSPVDPFTAIKIDDLDSGKIKPVINPIESRKAVKYLEDQGRPLMVWTFHCLYNTMGRCLEGQLSQMIYYHSVARKYVPVVIEKGNNPISEKYGIIKPEYNPNNEIDIKTLNMLQEYDKIVIAGEAADFCVKESISQILDYYQNDAKTLKKIYILTDCTSSIMETPPDELYKPFVDNYSINLVKSSEFNL